VERSALGLRQNAARLIVEGFKDTRHDLIPEVLERRRRLLAGTSADPVDVRLISWHRRHRTPGDADDDRRDRHRGGRQTRRMPCRPGVPDRTARSLSNKTESLAVSGEHEVLCRERAILHAPRDLGGGGDDDHTGA